MTNQEHKEGCCSKCYDSHHLKISCLNKNCPCHQEEKCEHKKVLDRKGTPYPEDYICRVCHPSQEENLEISGDLTPTFTDKDLVFIQEEKTTTDGLREEWRTHAGTNDFYEDMGIRLNQERIADWWLAKLGQALLQERQRMVEYLAKYPDATLADYYADSLTDKEE